MLVLFDPVIKKEHPILNNETLIFFFKQARGYKIQQTYDH